MGSIPLVANNIKTGTVADDLARLNEASISAKSLLQQQKQQAALAPGQLVQQQQQIQGGQQQLQSGAADLQLKQQQLKDNEAVNRAIQEDGDFSTLPERARQYGASGSTVLNLHKQALQHREDLTKADDTTLDLEDKKHEYLYNGLKNITDNPGDNPSDKIGSFIDEATNSRYITPQDAQRYKQQLATLSPDEVLPWAKTIEGTMYGSKGLIQEEIQRRTAGLAQYGAPLTPQQVSQYNSGIAQRWQVLHKGQPVPPEYVLGKDATSKDFDRVDKLLNSGENAEALLNQRNATNELAKQRLAQQAGNANPEAMVDLVGQGQMDLATALSRMPPGAKETFSKALAAKYPDYQQRNYGVSKKLMESATSGQIGQNLTAFNTAIEHAKQLSAATDALDNGNIVALNKIGNTLGYQFGSDKTTNFNVVKNALSGEISKVFKGGGATDAEIEAVQGPFNAANSPAQLKGAINQAINLMNSKRDALRQQVQQGMQGKPNFGENNGGAQGGGQTQSGAPSQSSGHKVGDIVTQNGRNFKVTSVDQNGKVKAATPQ